MLFPYDRYQTLTAPLAVYYPTGEEELARWVLQVVEKATTQLMQLLQVAKPELEILLVEMADWHLAPHSESEELDTPHPYISDVTTPPTLVVPVEIDPIFGDVIPEKFAYMLYHELVVIFLEADRRPWPQENPLWADEWQFKFIALWLAQQLDNVKGIVSKDLREEHEDAFEPEADGKTPVTIRGFDWFEDTDVEDYLIFELLLEQFAADLLETYSIDILPRFLAKYRVEQAELLSEDVSKMFIEVLGSNGEEWLENLVYF
ncbi:MAG TPA: hypothetical protein VL461_10120 [Dictyobacter sp.]|jgi:hypothetical protein|nr:hypothetical protein [Dictyobacter sp.]